MVLISVNSRLMLLYMAIGKGGSVGDPLLINIVNYYAWEIKMAPPSLIKSEIEMTRNLGLIEVDEKTTRVMFTEKGLNVVKEYGISSHSYLNPNFVAIKEMEARAEKTADKFLVQQIESKINQMRARMASEHLLWRGPPEWGLGWGISQPVDTKKEIVVGDNLKITKAPPKPRKIG